MIESDLLMARRSDDARIRYIRQDAPPDQSVFP